MDNPTNTAAVDIPLVDATTRAGELAELIVGRLADPNRYEDMPEDPVSLLSGMPGVALAFAQAARVYPERAARWLGEAHKLLVAAVQDTQREPISDWSVERGGTGLAIAFAACESVEPRYGKTVRRLIDALAYQVETWEDWRRAEGVATDDFDLISGACGVLAFLGPRWDTSPEAKAATDRLVDDLLWLCAEKPNWRINPESVPEESGSLRGFEHGYVNIGLAHGIPGPMAALAHTAMAGYRADEILPAVRRVADYLLDLEITDEFGPDWPMAVPLEADGTERRPGSLTAPYWCYGAPGVACALLTAAEALDDDKLRIRANAAFEAGLKRYDALHGEIPTTLCHGAAGTLLVCARFARAGNTYAQERIPGLLHAVADRRDDTMPFGITDIDESGEPRELPGLLIGAAGVAMAVWAATEPNADPYWERAMLIS